MAAVRPPAFLKGAVHDPIKVHEHLTFILKSVSEIDASDLSLPLGGETYSSGTLYCLLSENAFADRMPPLKKDVIPGSLDHLHLALPLPTVL